MTDFAGTPEIWQGKFHRKISKRMAMYAEK